LVKQPVVRHVLTYSPHTIQRAEHEAKKISDATRAALTAGKVRGKQLGASVAVSAAAPPIASRLGPAAAAARAVDLAPVFQDNRAAGAVSLRSIAKELNVRGNASAARWQVVSSSGFGLCLLGYRPKRLRLARLGGNL
jgi:hypothetical protein